MPNKKGKPRNQCNNFQLNTRLMLGDVSDKPGIFVHGHEGHQVHHSVHVMYVCLADSLEMKINIQRARGLVPWPEIGG